ncbi:hypothetical protein LCGC14_1531100 [marine sediment metagenome]|uniref:Uncharacterized protein n=1 Tax=marine sediment metagenome TaxID=412755 RepID=A0A0F9IVS8_9ZZZZ
MKKIGTPSTDAFYDRFAQRVLEKITTHGVEIGYHPLEGPNTLFEFVKSFDPLYRHPIGEAISKLRELAEQLGSRGPTNEWLENLEKAAAWIYLIHNDIERSYLGPTQNRTGSNPNPPRNGRKSKRSKLSRNARKGR